MVAIAGRDPAYAIDRVEWSLLLFFAALFVVMRGFEQTGAVDWIDRQALSWMGKGSPVREMAAVSGVRMVAMNSTFAGNLLLIGSMANLIVAERAQTRGVHIGFREYVRVGVPVTLLTIAWGLFSLILFR